MPQRRTTEARNQQIASDQRRMTRAGGNKYRRTMPYADSEAQRKYQRNWCAARRSAHIKARGGICYKCGSSEDLEFHHRDRTKKLDHKVWSWALPRIAAELEKCDLLCRPCHCLETATERGYYMAQHGTLTAYKAYDCRCRNCRIANAAYEHARRQNATHSMKP